MITDWIPRSLTNLALHCVVSEHDDQRRHTVPRVPTDAQDDQAESRRTRSNQNGHLETRSVKACGTGALASMRMVNAQILAVYPVF